MPTQVLKPTTSSLAIRSSAVRAPRWTAPGWETLADELKTVMTAAEQVSSSAALKSTLRHVLAIGSAPGAITIKRTAGPAVASAPAEAAAARVCLAGDGNDGAAAAVEAAHSEI